MSLQKFDHRSQKLLLTGTSGTGKTTLFEKLLRCEKARVKFIFDHQGEFAMRFDKAACYDADELCDATERGGYVLFDPVKMFPGKTSDAFRFFCGFVFEVGKNLKGRKILACDELQKLVDSDDATDEFLTILDTGRRYQIDVFCISQAPNRIHNAIRNQLTEVYTFRQSDANAVKYLAENGFDADAVRGLKNGEYFHRNLDTGELTQGGNAF